MRDQRAEVSLTIAPHEAFESTPVTPRDFRILILGDFSGRGDDAPLRSDAPRRIDRDDLDAHLARIAPRLRVEIDGAPVDLAFASIDDFHPDRLAARLASIERTAAMTAEPSSPSPAPSGGIGPAPDLTRAVSGASLLDDILDDVGAPQPRRADELSAFVDRVVAPHLVQAPDRDAAARAESKQQETARVLRRILHHPRVQALESTWRAIELLVRRLDTDGELHLFIFDVPREQIAIGLERLASQRQAAEAESWSLAISLHAFPDGDAGAECLARVAMAARTLSTPLVAAAPVSFAGRASATALEDDGQPAAPPEVYTLIRRSLEARFLGLTIPRVLLRVPYGRDNPCDTIDFEELDDPAAHDDYLWGSGASLVALLAGEAFNERGWAIGGRMSFDVSSLPFYTYRRGTETVAAPCAETLMSERGARHLLSRGLMPLAWIKNTDRVRLVELRSVADPAAPLAASWAGSTGSTA
jgi:type VI secretion system protein ImpC